MPNQPSNQTKQETKCWVPEHLHANRTREETYSTHELEECNIVMGQCLEILSRRYKFPMSFRIPNGQLCSSKKITTKIAEHFHMAGYLTETDETAKDGRSVLTISHRQKNLSTETPGGAATDNVVQEPPAYCDNLNAAPTTTKS